MVNEVGNNALRSLARTQHPASIAPDQVIVNSTLRRALRDFLNNIPRFRRDFDTIGGSVAGCAALHNCLSHIEHVEKKCKLGPVERPEILFELAQAAQLLDVAKHEVINKLPELVPGFAEKLFADFGLLFGLIAAAAILCAAPHLALAAGGLLITSFLGQGWAIEREDARENLVEIFAPQLEMIRSATVRAESAYTTEYIKARVSRVAAAHYEASLALPRSNPVNGALSGTESLPQWRVTADAEKSRLCLILLGIQTGAISIPDAQGRELLCKLLDAEALAQQQGLETDFQKNEAIRQDFLRLLDFLKYRPPVMQLIREGDAGENGTWAQGSEFERLLREHEEVIIDCGEQPASTQDRIRRDTGHVKARLGLPVGTAPDAHGT